MQDKAKALERSIYVGKMKSFVENYKHTHKVYIYDLQMKQEYHCLFSFFLAAQVLDFSFVTLCLKFSNGRWAARRDERVNKLKG
jgi:hypothetical protein